MTAQTPHVLVVTSDSDDRHHPYHYHIECPGVTDACRSWLECDDCPSGLDDGGYDEYDDTMFDNDCMAHGVKHHYIDGSWSRATNHCHVEYGINCHDDVAAQDLQLTEPGRYLVTFEYREEDNEYFSLKLVGSATS